MDLERNHIMAIAEQVKKEMLRLGIETEFQWMMHKEDIITIVQNRIDF